MGKFIDLTGRIFNRLKVLYRVENINNRTAYMCECDCGNKKIIKAKYLLNESTQSCGCYLLEKVKEKRPQCRKYNTYDLNGECGIGYTKKNEIFYFDLEDYDKIKDFNWFCEFGGYLSAKIPQGNIKMHRLLLDVKDSLLEVDHIDGVRFNNQKSNLRIGDKQQNQMNAGIRKDNSSGTKGVYWASGIGMWKAYIQYKNKRYLLGSHSNLDDAVYAREIAELKLFGVYSRRYEELKEKYKDVDLLMINL